MKLGDWVVVEVSGLVEIHENIGDATWVRLHGTETVDRRLLERVVDLHNQVLSDLC